VDVEMIMLRTMAVAVLFTLAGCTSGTGDGAGGGSGGGAGGGEGGGGGSSDVDSGIVVPDAGNTDAFYDGGTGGMPCPIAVMVKEKCMVCHGTPVAGNATFTLQSRADFLQPSAVDPSKSLYQQARIRLHNPFNPMPPVGYQQPNSDEVYAFDHWEVAGAPEDTCSPTALPAQPTTCASNSFWGFGNNGNAGMNPGLACRSCHLGQNFNGQNPTLVKETIRAYYFMGTVFADAHAKDLCNSPPPSGAKVEILDKNGNVALTLIPNGAGNFYSGGTTTSVALPYTARVTANGKTARMLTPQTSGDCNTCHTTQGLQGAPGRIYWPEP
jgi:cytochrome c5